MEETAPSLPVPLTLAACAVTLVLALLHVRRMRDAGVAFLLLSMWLRYSISAFHEYTFPPVIAGLSVVAVSSIITTGIGLAVVGARKLFLRRLLPFYVIMAAILVSAALNGTWIGAINAVVKWLYLIVFLLAAYFGMCRFGSDRILGALSVIFVAPIVLQWISVVLGVRQANEDGTFSFIAGYHHHQAFSIVLLTFLFITCFRQRSSLTSTYCRLAIVMAGLVLANYRTSLLAAALPATAICLMALLHRVTGGQRRLVLIFLAAVAVFAFVGVARLAEDRFADLGTAIQKGAALVQPPEHFTFAERHLFSGRAYLWSQYIDAYLDGTITERLVGFGPDSWVGRFPLYAHDTFISDLYEIGIFGTMAFIWILAANLSVAGRIQGDARLVIIACHVGFIILNLATMPIWTLEGDILYALLLAQTWYLASLGVTVQTAPRFAVAPA
jgi:hypothetical protein